MFLFWVFILLKNHHTNHKCNNNHDDHYDKNGINHSAKARGGGGGQGKNICNCRTSKYEISHLRLEARNTRK